MREIYVISLDDEIPLTENIRSNIREIAYLLFDEFNKYDREILSVDNDYLINNELYESFSSTSDKYVYRFTSDKSSIDYRMYEPFIIDDTSFGFTTYKDSTTEEEVRYLLSSVSNTLNFNYNFNISKKIYDNNNINNRLDAIDSLKNNKHNIKKLSKKRVASIFSVIGL